VGATFSADPIGLIGGLNPFRYAENQPTRMVDPNGLMADALVWNRPDGGANQGGKSGAAKTLDPAIQTAVNNAMGKVPNPGDTAGKCAEIEALSNQAADIRKKLGSNATDEQVREALREEYRNGAKIGAKDGKGAMVPCKFCAQVMRELGIHPKNINDDPLGPGKLEDKAKGGVMVGITNNSWDGKTVHAGDSPVTQPSTTPGATYNAPESNAGAPPPPPPVQYYDENNHYIGPRDSRKKSNR
jgi:hypothetical protein